jgi:hypothetical protein
MYNPVRCFVFMAASVVCAGSVPSFARESPRSSHENVLLALTRDYELTFLLGQYDSSHHHWLESMKPFTAPDLFKPFTLFGPSGKIAQVRLDEEFRTRAEIRPWEWDVAISSWNRTETTLALAVSGAWPDLPGPVQILPLDDAEALITAAAYLQGRHLPVSKPRVTQVLRADLNGDGVQETIICANSDNSSLNDKDPASAYSLALLRVNINGRLTTQPLRVWAAYKPTHEYVEDFERHYGRAGFYRVLALSDIDRDGRVEIAVLNNDPHYGPEVDFYTLAGNLITHLLAFRVVYF